MTKHILLLLAVAASIVFGAEPAGRGHATLSNKVVATGKDASSSATANMTIGLTVPVLGLFVDESGTKISAVTGVPGSASISDPIVSSARIWLAPSQTWALVQLDAGLAVLPFERATPGQPVPIEAALASPDLVAFAPQSSTAALFSEVQARFQLIRNGQVTTDFSTAGLFSSPIRKLAIDDAGLYPIAITLDGAYLLNASVAARLVYAGGAVSDGMFFAGGSTLLLADADLHQLTVVDDVAGAASNRLLATGLGSGNLWIQPSSDNKLVVAVCAGTRKAYRIDLATPGTAQVLDLPELPSWLGRVGNSGAFFFSVLSSGPMWTLIEDGGVTRVSFAVRPVGDIHVSQHNGNREMK